MSVRTGKNSLVEFSTNGTTFTAIPQVDTFKPPQETQDSETIHLLNSESEYAEKISTGLSCGNATVSVAYDPTNQVHQQLDELAANPLDEDDVLYLRVQHNADGPKRVYSCAGVSVNPQEVGRRSILKREYEFLIRYPVTLSSS